MALEDGDTAASIASDLVLPTDRGRFYVKEVRQHGIARYREALAGSYNLAAVHALQRVGIPRVVERLRRAGLRTISPDHADHDWGLAIGHAEVRLVELAAAFSTFGTGGVPVRPRSVRGEAETAKGERVYSEEVAWLVYDILSDPDARRPMFGDSVPLELPFPVALKTGTTRAYTDNWAVGTTREYTVGVWAGNHDGSPTHQSTSMQGATPLLRAVFAAVALRFGDPTSPPRPSSLVRSAVCPLSGQAPGPHCLHRKLEWFRPRYVPTEPCSWHRPAGEVRYPDHAVPWARFRGLLSFQGVSQTPSPQWK